jgi:CheY-like chemotaxis protein
LVVDDDESDRELAQRGLGTSDLHCRLAFAADGQEAVDFLMNPERELPMLVLLDLKMPRLNGREVLSRVREQERTKACPVVVFTSSGQAMDVLACFESGANSFVKKAIEFDEYIARIRDVVRYWLKVNEPCPRRRASGS